MPDKLTGKNSCPYNATHIIDEEVMAHHMETCPDRRNVDVFKYKGMNIYTVHMHYADICL
jgi:hypothetical protein